MDSYRFHVQQLSGFFDGIEFIHVRREQNDAADILSKMGSSQKSVPPEISLEHLWKPSIKPSLESNSIFVPSEPKTDADPIDIDARKGKGILEYMGTVRSDPGTSQPM